MAQYPVLTILLCVAAVLLLTIALVGLVVVIVRGSPNLFRESANDVYGRSGVPSPINAISLVVALVASLLATPFVQPWFHLPQDPTAAVRVAGTATPTQIVLTPTPTPTQVLPTPTLVPTPAQNGKYTSAAPGGCPNNDPSWQPRGNAGTTKCTPDGMDMFVKADMSFGEVAFDPQQYQGTGNLATYCVQTTAAFVTDNAGAAILIGVHGQDPGGQIVQFFQNGDLAILRFLHTGNHAGEPDPDAHLPRATFHAESPYRLAVGVDGPTITVWVNQEKIVSAYDPTYLSTRYVLLGLKADTSTTPYTAAEAIFSDFVFQAGTLSGCGS